MIIKLVRHGESDANIKKINPIEYPDSKIRLTDKGVEQALKAGEEIGKSFLSQATLYRSPYNRTRETSIGIIVGVDIKPKDVIWIEDPNLREIDVGYLKFEEQEQKRKTMGWFHYRFNQGESPADVFLRVSMFIDDMLKKEHEKVVIVAHGMTNRLIVMKLLDLTVEGFENLKNPDNCEVVTFYSKDEQKQYENDVKSGIAKPVIGKNETNGMFACSNMGSYNHEYEDFNTIFEERALNIKNNR